MEKPILSVYMTTYYHEAYVSQAIESVLRQKIDVPYEFIISDDASKDGTIKILQKYANRYPHIKLNLNTKNIGISRNVFLAKSLCTGEYIVGIAGDDYWIDDQKLQKQYSFLQNHSEYIGVATQLEVRIDNEIAPLRTMPEKKVINKKFTLKMFLNGRDFPLNGFMQKNLWKTEEGRKYFSVMPEISKEIDDLTDCILILKIGDIFILPDVTVAYRVRRKNIDEHNFNVSNKRGSWFKSHIELLNGLQTHFGDELNLTTRYAMVFAVGLTHAVYYRKIREFVKYAKTIQKHKIIIVIKSIKYIILKIFQVFMDSLKIRRGVLN